MKAYSIKGTWYDTKGDIRTFDCTALIDRTKNADGTYGYKIKDDGHEPLFRAESVYITSSEKRWETVLLQHFEKNYPYYFGEEANKDSSLFIYSVKL